MTQKLKLPLLIQNLSGARYVLSKSSVPSGVDITSSDGTVYTNHVSESNALYYLGNGTWTVVGSPQNTAETAQKDVDAAVSVVNYAKEQLKAAEDALIAAQDSLAAVRKPYLV